METTLETNPTETPVVEEEVSTAPDETTEQPSETEGQAPVEEVEEIELDGNKYKVPKEVLPLFMMHKDYTQKTQEVAEARRAVEAEREQFAQTTRDHQEFLEQIVTVKTIDAELAKFENVDWDRLSQENPQQALSLNIKFQQLNAARQNSIAELDMRSQQKAQANERERVNMLTQASAALQKPNPEIGWSGNYTPEVANKLTVFGTSLGFTKEQLAQVTNPLMVQTLHLAMIGKKALEQQRKAAKPPVVEAKPVPQVSPGRGGTVVKGLDDRLSIEEWTRRRNAQLKAR